MNSVELSIHRFRHLAVVLVPTHIIVLVGTCTQENSLLSVLNFVKCFIESPAFT